VFSFTCGFWSRRLKVEFRLLLYVILDCSALALDLKSAITWLANFAFCRHALPEFQRACYGLLHGFVMNGPVAGR
jgi:hypothetical protein